MCSYAIFKKVGFWLLLISSPGAIYTISAFWIFLYYVKSTRIITLALSCMFNFI